MQVQGHSPTSEFLYPDGIESAGNGFYKTGFLNGTEAVIPFEATVCALFGIRDQRGHQIAFTVDGKVAGSLGGGTPLFRNKMLECRIIPLQRGNFLFFERRSAIAHDAADTFANGVITGEKLADDILADEHVSYLDYSSEIFPPHLIIYSTLLPLSREEMTFITSSALTFER